MPSKSDNLNLFDKRQQNLILGSLSEAQQVFDAALLKKVIAELARRLPTPALPTGLFAVFKANPVAVSVTAGTGSERIALRHFMQPGGFYVFDRGYTDYALFKTLHDQACSLVGRVKANVVYEVSRGRPITPAASSAGVSRDVELSGLGAAHHSPPLPQPFRFVWSGSTPVNVGPMAAWKRSF